MSTTHGPPGLGRRRVRRKTRPDASYRKRRVVTDQSLTDDAPLSKRRDAVSSLSGDNACAWMRRFEDSPHSPHRRFVRRASPSNDASHG
jgi:hypothetical protein